MMPAESQITPKELEDDFNLRGPWPEVAILGTRERSQLTDQELLTTNPVALAWAIEKHTDLIA